MKKIRLLLFPVIISFLILGCKKSSNPSDENSNTPINKSQKRGIAFDMASSNDFNGYFEWNKLVV